MASALFAVVRARTLCFLVLAELTVRLVSGADLRVATLNCYLLFDPSAEHHSLAAQEERLTRGEYAQKVADLASLVRGYQVVGLQETGGEREIAALGVAANMQWAWAPGHDAATGEEVGVLYHLPGWHVAPAHRDPELDHLLSKHLVLDVQRGGTHVHFLIIHLLRPVSSQNARHRYQVAAVARWMRETARRDPGATVVVLGDTNSNKRTAGTSLFSVGEEAGEPLNYPATHLGGAAYDRLVAFGPAHWKAVEVRRPPYGTNPNAALKRLWTDHFLFGAVLDVP